MSGPAHTATISWTAHGDFPSGRYSRAHTWTFDGGATVAAAASPHNVPLAVTDAHGIDPEEALIASVSSCHMLWFLDIARQAGLAVARYTDEAVGVLGRDERGRMAVTRIELRPQIAFSGPAPDVATLAELHHTAHERCFIANSLRTEIVIARP